MVDFDAVTRLLQEYGWLIVFVIATLEALPLVGLLFPGQVFVVIAGVLAQRGVFPVTPVFFAAFTAGVIGDAVGYLLGRRYGRLLILKYGPRFRIEEKHLDKVDSLFQRFGPVALVLARFSFLTRGLGPLLAGMTRMRQLVFWPLNVMGAALWAGLYLALGFLFGESILLLEGVLGRSLAIGFLIAGALYLTYRALRKAAPRFTRADAALAVFSGFFVILFALLLPRANAPGPSPFLDAALPGLADALGRLAPFAFWRAVSAVTDWLPVALFVLAAFLYFAWRRAWWDAGLFALGYGGGEVIVGTLKWIIARPRPENPLVDAGTLAFPSAHAARALIVAGALAYTLARHVERRRTRALIVAAAVAVAALVGLSRIALRAHYATDVVGGWLVGGAWLLFVVLLVEFGVKRSPRS